MTLFISLIVLRVCAWLAALAGLLMAAFVALLVLQMIDAQSLVASSTVTQQFGREVGSSCVGFTHGVVLTRLIGAMVVLYAFDVPQAIPRP